MVYILLLLFFCSTFSLLYFVFYSKRIEINYTVEKNLTSTKVLTEPAVVYNPLILFNTLNIERKNDIKKGTVIVDCLFIIEGSVEIIYDGNIIGYIQKNEITYNCFDLLQLNYKIVKVAATDLVVGEVTNMPIGPTFLNIKYLERACFKPALKFFQFTNAIAKLENLKTSNFEDFLAKEFQVSNIKSNQLIYEDEEDIKERLVYIVSGSLVIDDIVFVKNCIFGYFGIFFKSYYGFNVRSIGKTILKYIPVSRLTNAVFNTKMLKNLLPEMIVLGATVKWSWIQGGYQLISKDTKCTEIYLVEGKAIGCKEYILEANYLEDFILQKTVSVTMIQKISLDTIFRFVPEFYKIYIKKMFDAAPKQSKLVLITPLKNECHSFINRLSKSIKDESIIYKGGDVLQIMGRSAFKKIGELILMEHISKLKTQYQVVIIYLEPALQKLIDLVSPYCDSIFIVGTTMVPNKFNRFNVECIKLHSVREIVQKLDKNAFKKISPDYFKTYRNKADTWETRLNNKISNEKLSNEDFKIDPLTKLANDESIKFESKKKAVEIQILNIIKRKLEFYIAGESNNPNYRRVHHILSPKTQHFCRKDYERFGRYLLDQRFGLVLGGGGARGFAHIGVIKALEEECIPIDVIGGTSMGAFVGGLYARSLDFQTVYSETKRLSKSGSSIFTLLTNINIPLVSFFNGNVFDRIIKSVFQMQKIQNFWLEFYCVTTNLKTLEENVHFNGSAHKYIMASMSISGILPPVFHNNSILCDGAYVNNIPYDVMSSMNAKNVISVTVGSDFNTNFDQYDSSSGMIMLFKRLFFKKQYMSLIEIQYRLTFISALQKKKLLDNELFVISPDLKDFKSSDFGKFDEIIKCGYLSAKTKIKEWKESGKIKIFNKIRRRSSY